jgi:thiol-disulfide isomerase/thioredoxin
MRTGLWAWLVFKRRGQKDMPYKECPMKVQLKRTCLLLVIPLFVLACMAVEGFWATPAPLNSEEAPGEIEVPYGRIDESPAPEKFTIVRVEKGNGELEDILRLEAHPYVEFYADWCPPCNALRESIGDERMIDAFEGTYIIQLDLDEWERNLSGTGFRVVGIPAFYEIDADGKPTGRMITGGAWGEDVPENIAPPMKEFFNAG